MVNCVVVVLGATSTKEAKPTPAMIRRTLSGCDYARTYQAALLCCGGATHAEHDTAEAVIMAQIAYGAGMEKSLVFQEGQSRSTLENAIFAKEIIMQQGWDEVLVVSDATHLLRARMIFLALGLKARYLKAHKEPKAKASIIFSLIYEVPALLYNGLRILRGHHKKNK
ncbi:conserved hypothetical protein [Candidatus Terasakiella magnetica]|uniref:DUF218 domain-containing protein n=1 Tax=Candidatus Terasakiella magnetica TaxID=1867952 RepID=A0A1C3RJX2_9PROT|nr:YdcF family protein [Candidatus Terasakiella magnetica]SCA57523.1 conserved hypothetical protein [Candidatus Terasakiella magnetica]